MNHQMIGIAGVFALAFFLFILRQWFLSLGRPDRSPHPNPSTPRLGRDPNARSSAGRAWVWSPKRDARVRSSNAGFGEHRRDKTF